MKLPSMPVFLQCGRFELPLRQPGSRPLVMGILNVTPDSFSDGGQFAALDAALSHAEQMIAAGVDLIDIGGESTRPGALPLSIDQELRRVLPLVYALRDCGKPVSVDTRKPQVMREVLAAGADMINDVNGFRADGALDAIRNSLCGLCVMHMQRDPQSMQLQPEYSDVVRQVSDFLQQQAQHLQQAGIARQRLCIDPGFGFGKTFDHNLQLLQASATLRADLNLPLLVGLSRKSMLGTICGKPVEQRLAASLAAAIAASVRGADIVRVHDVAETIDALTTWQRLMDPA